MRAIVVVLLGILVGACSAEEIGRLFYNTGKAYCDNPGPQPHCSRDNQSPLKN